MGQGDCGDRGEASCVDAGQALLDVAGVDLQLHGAHTREVDQSWLPAGREQVGDLGVLADRLQVTLEPDGNGAMTPL